MPVENIDLVVVNFRSNSVSGRDLLRFGDSEWTELIPFATISRQESRKSRKITKKAI
jgi:hypothetical protein